MHTDGHGELVKAKGPRQPPAGYEPAPNSKKGYYRKHNGQGYVYWHPKQGEIGPKSNPEHHADLVADRLGAMHARGIERERGTWGDKSAEDVRQRPARYTPDEVMEETGLPIRAVGRALVRAVERGDAQQTVRTGTVTRRIGLFGNGGYKHLEYQDYRFGPASGDPAALVKAAQTHLVQAARHAPALHAPTPSAQGKCGTKMLMPAKTGQGRRYQCVSRQRQAFHGEHARQLLHRLHRHGGEQPLTRHAAEQKHVQDLHGEGLIELRRNPRHANAEFTARLTAAGHKHVEREKAARAQRQARTQQVLFKALAKALAKQKESRA